MLQWHVLPCYRLTITFKYSMLPVCECRHILLYLMVGYLSVDLCRTDIAVSEHLAERFHRNTIGKANRGWECVASHVKGQALIYPAYLPDVHTCKGCFPYCEIGEYQVVRFLILDIERKDLLGNYGWCVLVWAVACPHEPNQWRHRKERVALLAQTACQ